MNNDFSKRFCFIVFASRYEMLCSLKTEYLLSEMSHCWHLRYMVQIVTKRKFFFEIMSWNYGLKIWVIFSKQLPFCRCIHFIKFMVPVFFCFQLHSKHLNISQFPDLTASNSIDVPNISDTMFGDLKEEKKYAKIFYHYTNIKNL